MRCVRVPPLRSRTQDVAPLVMHFLQQSRGDAERTIEWALAELGTPEAAREEVLRATLLSLKGWAGMMRQFELRPDRAPVEPRPARLVDYLAVQLCLDLFAARRALRDAPGIVAGARADPLPRAAGPAAGAT